MPAHVKRQNDAEETEPMTLTKCPRCELNYITDGEKYCKICRLEMKGEPVREEIEMCSMCGEHPSMPGKDVCLFCLKEMNGAEQDADNENDGLNAPEDASIGIDPISTMDEMIPAGEGDETDMSLEALSEEEDDADDDDLDEEDDGMGGMGRR